MGQILVDDSTIGVQGLDAVYPTWLVNFIDVYQQLGLNNLQLLKTVYHQNVTFIDPIHHVNGLTSLLVYFDNLYTNVGFCDFKIDDVFTTDGQASIYWTMSYSHKRLNSAQPIQVQGHSLLKMADDKVIYHRDYVDLGAMLYEHIPLLGKVIRTIKARASQ